eukprot:scaffold2482_cov131-Isochrysis_galbana.AAC.3
MLHSSEHRSPHTRHPLPRCCSLHALRDELVHIARTDLVSVLRHHQSPGGNTVGPLALELIARAEWWEQEHARTVRNRLATAPTLLEASNVFDTGPEMDAAAKGHAGRNKLGEQCGEQRAWILILERSQLLVCLCFGVACRIATHIASCCWPCQSNTCIRLSHFDVVALLGSACFKVRNVRLRQARNSRHATAVAS